MSDEGPDDDQATGYPVGRSDLRGTLARVTYRAPGMPPDLQREPDDLYEGRPAVPSSWQRYLAEQRARASRGALRGLAPRSDPSLER